jgi:hypothetical protein
MMVQCAYINTNNEGIGEPDPGTGRLPFLAQAFQLAGKRWVGPQRGTNPAIIRTNSVNWKLETLVFSLPEPQQNHGKSALFKGEFWTRANSHPYCLFN